MKTSDHFIGVPAASLPGTSVFAIPGAGFQALGGDSASKSDLVSRPTLIRPSCFEKSAVRGATERPESSRLTWSGDGGAVRCQVGCTLVWKSIIGSGPFLCELLLFLGMVLRRRASSPLKGTEGDRQPALSRCKVASGVPCVVV